MKAYYFYTYIISLFFLLINVNKVWGVTPLTDTLFKYVQQEDYDIVLNDRQHYSVGILLGFNAMRFYITPYDNNDIDKLSSKLGFGFHFGITNTLRINYLFDLKVTPSFSLYSGHLEYLDFTRFHQNYGLSAVEIPLHINYKLSNWINPIPYITGGVKFAWILDYDYNSETYPLRTPLKPINFYPEFGVGLIRQGKFIRLSTELKSSFGLMNMLGSSAIIEKLNARMISVSFIFE